MGGQTTPSDTSEIKDDNSDDYLIISVRITARRFGTARATRPTRPTPSDPLRPTWSLRVARRVARVAPSRSESLDRAASSDQSRLKRSPERPRDTIFNNFGWILGPIFIVFRGCIARATRLAARRAEPLFLLAGALLRSVYTFSDKPEKLSLIHI